MLKRKWWGSKNQRPIVCLHGWQDNAGSFDKLIPLLPPDRSYLALDFPGHGYSSHLQPGLFYFGLDTFLCVRRIQKYFNWDKMSFLSHSMGSIQSFNYSVFYPDEVDFYIGIDAVKPLSVDPVKAHGEAAEKIEELFKLERLDPRKQPVYTEEELMRKWIKSGGNSLTEESCRILMKRGTVRTEKGVQLIRDARLKGRMLFGYSHEEIQEFAENIKCNVCVLKFDWRFYDTEEFFYDILNIVKNNAKYYEFHKVNTTHHGHLNNPELVAPIVTNFLNKVSA